ncbi:hypothetical protein [Massilia antarctica]|uniref:hypothetical protein n=1 Tax=Massilia antarctica TaxID=2765360 RepID=UPI0006BB76EA|nr:hypothetical protein [Massilia sp. H27-R4]MCY0911164.1 hypothetical protein [Massilia sp. H27-R4]CUI05249.1 hypothetical protein BN2497_5275 [Janthinobacterium sp. CG23_2]CUU29035.1 hypothetical protein BN3177_5275 [Janthinobacterium sp. CG23_2]
MAFSRILPSLALACGAASAQAASFDCVAPEFPDKSVSSQAARRVDEQVRAWEKCYAQFRAGHWSIDAARQNDEVAAGLERWMTLTRTPGRTRSADTPVRAKRDSQSARFVEQAPVQYAAELP